MRDGKWEPNTDKTGNHIANLNWSKNFLPNEKRSSKEN